MGSLRRAVGLGLGVAVAALLVLAVPAHRVEASHRAVLGPVSLASCSGVRLVPGRLYEPTALLQFGPSHGLVLNGAGFSLIVSGYGLTPCVPGVLGGPGLVAPPGDDVAVVSVILEQPSGLGLLPELSFSAGGLKLWHGRGSLGADTYCLAVRAGTAVIFSATEDGVTQSFSLASGARTGTVPEALYRSPIEPSLLVTPNTSATIRVSSGGQTEYESLTLFSVDLGYFSPAGQPGGAGWGWLSVDLLSGGSASLPDWLRALPTSRVRLVVAAPGPPVHLAAVSVFSELGGTYDFRVPAGLTKAELELAPGTVVVGGTKMTVSGAGFAISLPRPPHWLTARNLVAKLGNGGKRGAAGQAAGAGIHTERAGSAVVVVAVAGGSSLVVVPVLLVIHGDAAGPDGAGRIRSLPLASLSRRPASRLRRLWPLGLPKTGPRARLSARLSVRRPRRLRCGGQSSASSSSGRSRSPVSSFPRSAPSRSSCSCSLRSTGTAGSPPARSSRRSGRSVAAGASR